MTSTSLTLYNGFSQNNNGQNLDEGRRQLKEDLTTLLNNEEAEPDLISRCHSLLSQYPDLAGLKQRIRYPEEIPIDNFTSLIQKLEDASRSFTEIKPVLQQLADYYRNFVQKFTNSPKEIQAVLLSPKARIQGDLIDQPYLVTQEVARKFISRNRFGDIIKLNDNGNHPVVALKGVHLKSATDDEPLDTGMEISVYILHTLLFGEAIGPGLAPSSLLTLENVEIREPSTPIKESDEDHFEVASKTNRRGSFFRRHPEYPVTGKPKTYHLQASKTIQGKRLDQVLDDPTHNPNVWDDDNFSSLILASFLTIPSDNKPDNFMVTTGETVAKIIGIDNDMAFAYPLTAYGQKKEHMVGFKNALLCFDKMMNKSISPKVRERIAKLDPILLGIEWAAAVMQQEQRFPAPKTNQVQLPLRFTKHTLQNLIENLIALQKVLSDPYFIDVTHRQLFRLLFPVVERYYQVLSKDTTSTIDRIDNLFSNALPPVERYLKQNDKLEDGRTINEALTSSEKRALAYQEERDTPIEELCCEVLRKIDLAQLPPAKLTALLSLTARHFPKLVSKELHPSWRSETLPFSLIYEQGNLNVLSFLEKLGVDLKGQNNEGDTIVHLLLKQGLDLPKEVLKKTQELSHATNEMLLEVRNSKGYTPLDIAMEQGLFSAFIALIDAGAGITASSTNAWMFYKGVVKNKNNPHLTEAFQRLIKRNQGIAWKMAKETIFPSEIKDGVVAISALNGKKGLHSDAIKQLWKSDGAFIAVNTTGKRAVGKATVDGFTLYFKQAPELAGIEQAVGTLMHQIMGFGAPHTDLVKIKGIPYLVSQGIQGLTLQQVLEMNPQLLNKLDQRRLSQLFLMTMLINPEDGKPDNYIIEPLSEGGYQIVSIDNDHAFVPSVAKETLFGSKQSRVQVKTILYCLDQMKDPIDISVREQFLKHDPAEVLMQWLSHLSSVHNLYNDIYPESERKNLFENHGVFVGIPLRAEMVAELYRKMVKMQFLLDQEKDNPKLSHIDLLMKLDRALGQRYYGGFAQTTPMQRFLAIDGKDYDINKGTLISTRQAKEILHSYDITTKTDMKSLISRGTALDAEAALKKLQEVVSKDQKDLAQRLLSVEGANMDFASLSADQVADILKKIDFSTMPIPIQQSILGQIKKFAFKSLHIKNASLVTNAYLKGLDCSQLTTLELPGCQSLTDSVVEQILGQAPQLKNLNLSCINSFEKVYGVQGKYSLPIKLDLKKVTHLILNSCPKLHTLKIEGNQLAVVECEGDNLRALEIESQSLSNLNVKGNKELNDDVLDYTISKCPNVMRLNVEDCDQISEKALRSKIPGLPASILNQISDMSSSLMEVVISLFANRITELVYPNDLKVYEQDALNRALKANTSLTNLLCYNSSQPEKIEAILYALTPGKSLLKLALAEVVEKAGLVKIANALKINKSLKELDLSYVIMFENEFKDVMIAFADALIVNQSLNIIRLSGIDIGIEGAIALSNGLKSNNSLSQLILNDCSIGNGVFSLAEALGTNPNTSLSVLNLSGNNIGNTGSISLAGALKTNTSISQLNLSNNYIGDEGARALIDAIKSNNTLYELDLSKNWFGDECLIGLADVLTSNTSLAVLNLEKQKLQKGVLGKTGTSREQLVLHYNSKQGVAAIFDALKSNKTLKELKLFNRRIEDEKAKLIADAIKSNTSLIKLDLHLGRGNKGMKFIGEALESNKSIKTLTIIFDGINDESAEAMSKALESNSSLQALSLLHDDIQNEESEPSIQRKLRRDELSKVINTLANDNKLSEQVLKAFVDFKGSKISLEDLKRFCLTKEEKEVIPKLVEIYLEEKAESNFINEKGVNAIAKGLESNKSLKELRLSLPDHSLEGLAEALKCNSSLEKLHLRLSIYQPFLSDYGGIKSLIRGAKTLVNALDRNTSLIHLGLKITGISGDFDHHDNNIELDKELKRMGFTKGEDGNLDYIYNPKNLNNTSLNAAPQISLDFEDPSDHRITPDAFYSQGKVLEKTDLQEAIDRYLEAAKQKHGDAFKKLEELSKSSLHAQNCLGCYYEYEKDLSQAAFYYAMATAGTHLQAKQALCRLAESNPEAQSQLAILMERGLGMRENIEQALILHQKAADKGIGNSKLHLGILYYMGYSTEENRDQALSLISQAESQGVPQAGKIKAQIQKEIIEKNIIIERAKNDDKQLYLLANKKSEADLLSQLSLFDKTAVSESQVKRMKMHNEAFERQKTDLLERIKDLETQKATASSTDRQRLKNQIEMLETDLTNLEKTQKVHSEPVEEARQFYLNKKRELFYSGFKEKIATVLKAVDAILSGDASRNTSLAEKAAIPALAKGAEFAAKAAASVVPFAGTIVDIAAFAIGKYITHKKDEQVNKQCNKIQGYYPEQGLKGIDRFSSLLAEGLVYRFQDHIPHLDGESIDRLIKHFVISFADYLFEKALDDASIHELLLGGAFHKPTNLKDIIFKTPLKTNYGFEMSIDDLLFSTGLCTPYGGKYLPKDPKRRAFISEMEKKGKEIQKKYPIYRLGTKEEIDMLANMGIEMECVEEERIGALATTIDRKKAAARYMQEAESLARQFLAY